MIQEIKHIQVLKTARYVHLRTETKVNKRLLFVLHGYGQLSTFFSRKFHAIHPDFDVVVAEGMHRFYTQGSSGRVGASWMTKEDRETDIYDNKLYLKQLIDNLSQEYSEIVLLGFSQGGATAARCYSELGNTTHSLILWASVTPPDLCEAVKIKTHGKKYFILGTNDEFFDREKQKEVLALQTDLGFETHLFNGKHGIEINELNTILSKL